MTDRQTDRQTDSYSYRLDKLLGEGKYCKFSQFPSDKEISIGRGVKSSTNLNLTSYADMESMLCRSRGGTTESIEESEDLESSVYNLNARTAMLLGVYEVNWGKKKKGIIPREHNLSQFSQVRYKFFLDAPFEISSNCCSVMKKKPIHDYNKKTGRYGITAQMASESRLRTQQWLRNGCNGFEMNNPISNPMSFWTEQDVLVYIKTRNIPIASVYGEVITDYQGMGQIENQMSLADLGLFDKRDLLKTSGCSRTGCIGCGYGCHLEKRPNRLEMIDKVSNPALRDWILRGGAFDENGLWKPDNRGLGFWFVYKWINVHGGFDIYIPEYERYETEYGTEKTKRYLSFQ